MAILQKQNPEDVNLDSLIEMSSISFATGTPKSIVYLSPGVDNPNAYIGERLRRDVVVDGVTTSEQYLNKIWLVSDLANVQSSSTVEEYMSCILEGKFVDITANTLTIPDDIVSLNEV